MLIDPSIVSDIDARWRSYGGDRLRPRDLGAKSDAARRPGAAASPEFWARRGLKPDMDGRSFKTIAADPAMRIEGLSLAPEVRAERILGSSDLLEVVFLEVALAVSRTVARVRVNGPAGTLAGYGTGFLVSPRLLLTNWHVLKTADWARASIAEFGYETRMGAGAAQAGTVFKLQPERFFLADPTLDFALVAVAASAVDGTLLSRFGFNRLVDDDDSLIAKGQFANIIQHPSGQPKQFAFRENEVVEKPGDFLHYRTDTAPGSSGALVCNDQWQAVALHRAGVWATNDAGQILAIDGTVWRDDMGEDRIRWLANEGVRIPRLMARWRNPPVALAGSDHLDELFAPDAASILEGPAAPEALRSAAVPPPVQAPPPEPAAATAFAIAPDGTATWTLPLRVSVALGSLAGGGAVIANAVAAAPQPAAAAPTAAAAASAGAAPDLETVLARAREVLMTGRTDVLRIRAGWVYDEVGITDRRALVVVVRRKRTPSELAAAGVTELPRLFEGYPLEIMGPSVEDLVRLHAGPERAEALTSPAATAAEITYQPPPGLSLAPVTDMMHVVAHVSPDAGWPMLKAFIAGAGRTLVGAMYEFTAEHIREALTAAARKRDFKTLTLVLDSARGSIRNDPAIRDSEAMVRDMRAVLGDRLDTAWVKLGSVNGWVNHDYHIKVLVRDRKAFWLSSGNWKASSQPDADPKDDPVAVRKLLDKNNREWHAIIEHPGLAQTYETAILGDFAANRATRPEELFGLPELWFLPPPPVATEAARVAEYFAPFDEEREFTVQPILTPDNYIEAVLPALRRANTSLLIQNQSLSVPFAGADPRYLEFWNLVLAKQRRGLDVRLIFRLQERDPAGGREMHEKLKDFGFDTNRIRMQTGCHTKGMVIDGKMVLLGSHNLTNMGATTNRDASLLFEDSGLAAYFGRIFEHDWRNVAQTVTRRQWRGGELLPERPQGGAEEGFQPFDWKGWLEGR